MAENKGIIVVANSFILVALSSGGDVPVLHAHECVKPFAPSAPVAQSRMKLARARLERRYNIVRRALETARPFFFAPNGERKVDSIVFVCENNCFMETTRFWLKDHPERVPCHVTHGRGLDEKSAEKPLPNADDQVDAREDAASALVERALTLLDVGVILRSVQLIAAQCV